MKPYRVTVRVHNNLILNAIREAGYPSQAAFAREQGIKKTDLAALIRLQSSPIGKLGAFTKIAQQLMEGLGACPTDLWTPEQLTMKLRRNSTSRELDADAFLRLTGETEEASAERLIFSEEIRRFILSGELSKNEHAVLQLGFGLGGGPEHTSEEIGGKLGLSGARVSQIRASLLSTLKKRLTMAGLQDCVE